MKKYKDDKERKECSFVVEPLSRLTNLPAWRCYSILRRKDKFNLSLMDKYDYLSMCDALKKLEPPKTFAYCLGTIATECEKTNGIRVCHAVDVILDGIGE